MRADANGTRIKYFDIELENVLIGLVTPGVKPGTILVENFSLKFSKVRWKAGHIAGYDGKDWISDFVQNGFWPGKAYRTERPDYVIYRY